MSLTDGKCAFEGVFVCFLLVSDKVFKEEVVWIFILSVLNLNLPSYFLRFYLICVMGTGWFMRWWGLKGFCACACVCACVRVRVCISRLLLL